MFETIKRNLGYKIFSLIVATLLYYVASAQQNPHVTRDLYIQPEVVKLPQSIVVKDPPAPFPLTVTGPESVLNKTTAQSIRATIDGAIAKPGVNRLPIAIVFPPGIQSSGNDALPMGQFTTEKKDQKEYGVDVLFAGTAPPGQEYGDPIAIPSNVTVEGLSDDLKRVGRVVAHIEREDNELAVERMVTLVAEDQDKLRVDGVEIIPPQVKVRVKLHPVPTTKTMLLSVEFRGKPAPGFRIASYDPQPNQITVRGAIETLSSRSSITIPVDISGLKESTTKTVTVALPSGIQPQEALPPIKVRLEVQPIPAIDGGTQQQPREEPSPTASTAPPGN